MTTGTAESPASDEQPEEAPPAPLLRLRDGLPDLTDTPEGLRAVVAAVSEVSGPVALDAVRAT
jgi:ribonuclease D